MRLNEFSKTFMVVVVCTAPRSGQRHCRKKMCKTVKGSLNGGSFTLFKEDLKTSNCLTSRNFAKRCSVSNSILSLAYEKRNFIDDV